MDREYLDELGDTDCHERADVVRLLHLALLLLVKVDQMSLQ